MNQNKVEMAKGFCAAAHGSQKRKYTGAPYYIHPWAVAEELKLVPGISEDAIIAGYLHDVLEDTTTTEELIENIFGAKALALVKEVTDVSKPSDGNREHRKRLDLIHLAKSSPEGATIKLADMINNSSSIMIHDPDFAKIYLKEKEQVLKVLLHGNAALLNRAWDIVNDYKTLTL